MELLKQHAERAGLDTEALFAESQDDGDGKKASAKRDKAGVIARFESLVDIVEDDGATRFLTMERDKPGLLEQKTLGGRMFVPPAATDLPFLLPRFPVVAEHMDTDSDKELFRDVLQYVRDAAELPSEGHYTLITWWLLHTAIYDRFNYSPYLVLFAVPERGKSRLLKSLAFAALRGLATETLNEANLFRWSHDLGASVFFDVKDLLRKAERKESEDLLLHRFERGSRVGRVLWPERGPFKDTRYFDVFGPTAAAVNEPLRDPLLSRCIVVTMPESARRFDNDVEAKAGLVIRERLVAFRARWLTAPLPQVGKPFQGRLGDLLKPIATIAAMLGQEDEFSTVAQLLYRERQDERATSDEASLVTAYESAHKQAGGDIVSIQAVTDACNSDLPERMHRSPSSIGKRLRALGFRGGNDARLPDGTRGVLWDPEKLGLLKVKYGLVTDPVATEVSVLSKCQDRLGRPSDSSADRCANEVSGLLSKAAADTPLTGRHFRQQVTDLAEETEDVVEV